MSSSLNPKKLKVILTSLRETITTITADDSSTTSSSSVTVAYTLLLVSELSSRGIGIINLPSSIDGYTNFEFIISLLEGVQSAAGKISIDDVTNNSSGNSEYPQPMMAALNAASGMTASALVTLLNSINTNDDQLLSKLLLPMDNKQINETVQTIMKRCLEVNDGRFYILLKMAYDLYSSSTAALSTESSDKRTIRIKQQVQSLKLNFNTVAYSNYLYGASNFGVDQMPLWKRCLDSVLLMNSLENDTNISSAATGVVVEGSASTSTSSNSEYKQYQNSLTILPLQNMIRIAQSKGNTKRVNELSLLICLGYMNGVECRLDNIKKNCSSNNSGDKKEEEKKLDKLSAYQLLTQYYLHRSNSLIDIQDYNTSKMLLDSCQESFNKVTVPTDISDTKNYETYLLYYYVQCQIIHYREECKIWIEFQNEYKRMNNRRPDNDTLGSGGVGFSGSKKASSVKSISSTSSKTTTKKKDMTKDEMEQYIRNKVYIDTYDESLDDIPLSSNTVITLRDAIISLSSLSTGNSLISTDIVQDCYSLIMYQIQRLVDIGILVQQHVNKDKKKTKEERNSDICGIWQVVLTFVSPLMKDYLAGLVTEDDSEGTSLEVNNSTLWRLLECCSQAVITASWMYEPLTADTTSNKKELFDLNTIPNLLSMAHSCLIACQKERMATEKRVSEEKKKQTSVLSSHDGQSEVEKKELIQFQCALSTSKCRKDLYSAAVVLNEKNGEVSTDALMSAARKATIAATKSSSSSSSSVNSKYGSSYIQFLSAWSGLYHSPWPFCTVGQARTILRNARETIASASKVWGRGTMSIEQVLLDIAEADLEGCLLGGFENVSEKLYHQTLSTLEDQSGHIKEMLKVHCLLGLARLSLSSDSSGATTQAEELARQALDILASPSDSSQHESDSPILLCIYAWSAPFLNQLSHSYHVCESRQLVADACIRSSRPEDARVFLTEAVKDLPGNFEAAFALAAFHLRIVLGNKDDKNEVKKTKTLLLKAAKLDTSKPQTFALLGIWYETQDDTTRAKGCYQKALGLDPCHPVAGRGIQRLMSQDEAHSFYERAAKQSSSTVGWAWRALAQQKSRDEGDDTTAVVCLQQALRCRDIQSPTSDNLSLFYENPTSFSTDSSSHYCEASETWALLATCYRLLGKHSAALRAYEAADAISNGNLSPDTLCNWAQADIDLGLYEEAAEKCAKVTSMSNASTHVHHMAAYIEGEALLFLARNCVNEGKFGQSKSFLEKGISRLSALSTDDHSSKNHYCEVKLLGDLYSSGSSLPPYVFAMISSDEHQIETEMLTNQLSFLKKGEDAYTLALELSKKDNGDDKDEKEDNMYLIAAAATDLGTNLLSQARVVSKTFDEGIYCGTSSSSLTIISSQVKDLLSRSINAYVDAIDSSPHEASAWCGLGCALIAIDPTMSQHAFSRGLQLDSSLADSWSNIGLLYAEHDTDKCSEVLDYLTQVDDTPLMWIGRGFLLEKSARAWTGVSDQDLSKEACLTKAADAYRAALQIMQHPAALLGLSLTCRRTDPRLKEENEVVYAELADKSSKLESRLSMDIHQSLTGNDNVGASLVSSMSQLEEGLDRLNIIDDKESARLLVDNSCQSLKRTLDSKTDEANGSERNEGEYQLTKCEVDLSVSTLLKNEKKEEFSYDMIKSAIDQATSTASSSDFLVKHMSSCTGLVEARNNINLNPDSGEAWLIVANELAQESKTDASILSSAKVAAQRAFDLLNERVVNATLLNPRRQTSEGKVVEYSDTSVASSIPSATLLSQSMALLSCLKDMKEETSEEEDESQTLATLQESLLLDPSNSIAAASLGVAIVN